MTKKLMIPLLVCILSLCGLGLTGGCSSDEDKWVDVPSECTKHDCTCRDDAPTNYSVSIYFEHKLEIKVPYTVKWEATRYGGGSYATVPTTVHKITLALGNNVFYSFNEPLVSDSGMMRFKNALTGQREAIHFLGVHWVVQEVFVMNNEEGHDAQSYARKYLKAHAKCKACNDDHKHSWYDY